MSVLVQKARVKLSCPLKVIDSQGPFYIFFNSYIYNTKTYALYNHICYAAPLTPGGLLAIAQFDNP